ncbi:MAG: hypothetical protein GX126_01980 [Bacteroidales bacterium]|nr:hypothetical protein [Bacteroidales bacterium]
MLNLGFIGDIKLLEPYIKRIRKNSKIHITGKSSVGVKLSEDDFRFSVPEFNRIELIERSDILVINHFSLLPYDLISKSLKKGKHIFAVDYPNYGINEFEELAKLAKEANIVFQFSNPLFNHPAVQWIKNNIKPPAYWDITCYKKDYKDELLTGLLMMLQGMVNGSPKKISSLSFKNPLALSEFINLRLDYGNATIVNLNFGSLNSDEFTTKAFAPGIFVALNFITKNFSYNNSKINPGKIKFTDEFDIFIENTQSKRQPVTEIEDYIKVLHNIASVKSKLSQFSDS